MNNQKGSIPILILALILVLGAFYLYFSGTGLKIINSLVPASSLAGTTETPTAPAQIIITKDGFIPAILSVARNQPVTFINKDNASHQVLIDSLDIEAETLAANETFTLSFDETGQYTFSEPDKPNSKGNIDVK